MQMLYNKLYHPSACEFMSLSRRGGFRAIRYKCANDYFLNLLQHIKSNDESDEGGVRMTALRKNAIEELGKAPEDKLAVIIQFIHKVTEESAARKNVWDLDQFVMTPTERGQDADAYVRELRDNDRL